MRESGPHRRAFLRRLAALGLAGAGYLALREQIRWPTPKVAFAAGGSSGWLPLPRAGGLIALPARLAGTEIQAVVDSGAQYSAVDSGLAERLDLPLATPIPMVAFGVSGAPSLARGVRLDLDLGAFTLKGLRAATLNLHPLSGLTRQPFSLLLGRDFLQAVVMDADFPGGRVAFAAPERWRPPPDARPVPAQLHSGALMVHVRIEDAPELEVMLDTGATGGLALSAEAARAVGLLDGRPVRRNPSVTLGGVSEDGAVRARRIGFAGETFEGVDVQIYSPAPHSPAPKGLLGLGVLERFRMVLDLPSGRVFLVGPQQPPRRRARRRPTRFAGFADSGRAN